MQSADSLRGRLDRRLSISKIILRYVSFREFCSRMGDPSKEEMLTVGSSRALWRLSRISFLKENIIGYCGVLVPDRIGL